MPLLSRITIESFWWNCEILFCVILIFLACQDGKYGKNCLKTCSANCVNPQCNKMTGECIGGCNDGWQELECTQSLFLFLIPFLFKHGLTFCISINVSLL